MILDCVCVDIRISRSPLPRMLAMVLLCGYSGHGDTETGRHGDMETLAQSGYPVHPVNPSLVLTRVPASEARPGPGALLGAQIFLLTCTRLMHRIAACCTTNRIIPARLYTDWGFRKTIHQMKFSPLRSGRGWVNSWERGTVQSSVRLICLGQLCLLTRHQATASGQWSRQQHDLGWKHLLILGSKTRRYLALCSP